jgi:hypothetical protein
MGGVTDYVISGRVSVLDARDAHELGDQPALIRRIHRRRDRNQDKILVLGLAAEFSGEPVKFKVLAAWATWWKEGSCVACVGSVS